MPRPRALLLRVFKEERVLEIWVAGALDGPLVHLGDHAVCASSGGPGPKARAGDGQVPEGLYRVTTLNPWSRFHLSLRLDYPNEADRARNPGVAVSALGGEIFVHGNCVTIGCIPIGDEAIEEVYLAALETRAHGGQISVLDPAGQARQLPVDGPDQGFLVEGRAAVAFACPHLGAPGREPPRAAGHPQVRRDLRDGVTAVRRRTSGPGRRAASSGPD